MKPTIKRSVWIILLALLLVGGGIVGYRHFFVALHHHTMEETFEYTCNMHPHIVSDKPGKCPICGMRLTKRIKTPPPSAGEHSTMHNMGHSDDTAPPSKQAVHLSPTQRLLANVATTPVVRRSLTREIRAVGKVTYNENTIHHITARVPGRVDQLFVKETGSTIHTGDPLLKLYSPELISAQKEYLLAIDQQDEDLMKLAKRRMALWGITEDQIKALQSTKEMKTHFTLHAHHDGVITHIPLHEGMYAQEGTMLYNIANLESVWILADIYEYEMKGVHIGQTASVTTDAYPGETFHGKVSFIHPFLNASSRSIPVRLEFTNQDGKLKPDMYVNVILQTPLAEGIVVPRSAILNTGDRQVAWVETAPNRFEPRSVIISDQTRDAVRIAKGLQVGDQVVTQAGFLIDSEAQLKHGGGSGGHRHD